MNKLVKWLWKYEPVLYDTVIGILILGIVLSIPLLLILSLAVLVLMSLRNFNLAYSYLKDKWESRYNQNREEIAKKYEIGTCYLQKRHGKEIFFKINGAPTFNKNGERQFEIEEISMEEKVPTVYMSYKLALKSYIDRASMTAKSDFYDRRQEFFRLKNIETAKAGLKQNKEK